MVHPISGTIVVKMIKICTSRIATYSAQNSRDGRTSTLTACSDRYQYCTVLHCSDLPCEVRILGINIK